MVLHGPALEKRQALLFRCVDIGAELFAMAATCVRAQRDARQGSANAVELADLFCRQSRRKIGHLFAGIRANDDVQAYKLARGVLDDRFAWLEQGIVDAPTEAAAEEPARAREASAR